MAATTLIGSAAVRPAKADAWAWQNVCVANVFNQSGAQSAVRPTFFTSLPEEPRLSPPLRDLRRSRHTHVQRHMFRVTGWPAPAFGCHVVLTLTAPGSQPRLYLQRANRGPQQLQLQRRLESQHPREHEQHRRQRLRPPIARQQRSSARSRPGKARRQGDQTGSAAGERLARRQEAEPHRSDWAVDKDSPGAGVVSEQRGPADPQGFSNLLVNPGGGRGVGAVVGSYAGRHAAHQTAADALSRHSIHLPRPTADIEPLPYGGQLPADHRRRGWRARLSDRVPAPAPRDRPTGGVHGRRRGVEQPSDGRADAAELPSGDGSTGPEGVGSHDARPHRRLSRRSAQEPNSITLRIPSCASISSKPRLTSSSVIRCEMNGSTSISPAE